MFRAARSTRISATRQARFRAIRKPSRYTPRSRPCGPTMWRSGVERQTPISGSAQFGRPAVIRPRPSSRRAKDSTLLTRIQGDLAASPDVRRELVVAHSQVGDLLSATGDTTSALVERRTALAMMETLSALAPTDVNNIRQLGVAYHKLGNSLGNPNYPNVGDHQGALENLERSGEVFRKAMQTHPTNAVFRRNAAVIDTNVADVLGVLGRSDEALERQRRGASHIRGTRQS